MTYNLTSCIQDIKLVIDKKKKSWVSKDISCKNPLIHGCILGKGRFGTVCYVDPNLCEPPIDNLQPLALKYIKDKRGINEIKKEVDFLNELKDVPNVLNIIPLEKNSTNELYIHMFNEQEYCIATEYLNGKELSDYIIDNPLSKKYRYELEPDFKTQLDYIAQQLILTLKHIHDKNILHLDIKPGNILLDNSTIPPRPVFIDFGQAKNGLTHDELQYSGTPEYYELIDDKITRFNDIYALGRTLGEMYFFMGYSTRKNVWIDHKYHVPIIKDLDYPAFIDSFLNLKNPNETITKYDELVEQIKVEPIESRPNPTPVVDHIGMVSTVRNPVIDPEIDVFNNLQLEAYVRLKKSNIYDFTHLIHSIRDIKGKLKKLFNLKSTWYHRKTKLEKYPGINKLVHVDSSKLKKGRPTLVEKPNITKVDYDNMETLIENGNEPSKNYILNEEEVEVDKWALRVKSKRNSKGGKKKSRRKRSRRKGKRSINKRKIKQSRNKKQSKKRY